MNSYLVARRLPEFVLLVSVVQYTALAQQTILPEKQPEPGGEFTVRLDLNRSMAMVWLAPGTFVMGSPGGESGRRTDEGPLTRVTISHGFWLGKTPVTQAQYEAVMGVNPSDFKMAGPNAPVESVSWTQAMEFCHRLTVQERRGGRLPAGYSYTLPTEAQWEYACRAGTTSEFYNGDSGEDLSKIAWCKANAHGTTHPVGQLQPNAWGLYDMLGNLWQWCADWYGPYSGGSVTDPAGPPTGMKRNNRGGSWDNFPDRCRSAARSPDDPSVTDNTALGFRLALAPEHPANR